MKVLGKNPSGEHLKKIVESPNYKNGKFQNVEHTEVMADVSFFQILREYINKPASVKPSSVLPTEKTDLHKLDVSSPTVIWLGHSSIYLAYKNFRMLVDPVLSGHASPITTFGKAFEGSDVYGVKDFPELDVLLITHDHYDHLDYKTVLQLIPKTKRIITALGVGSHLRYWGIPGEKITELDWWETATLPDFGRFTAAPSRHFSGRSIPRAKTLWASFVLNLFDQQIYLGGDSGYGSHFKTIGEKFSRFDFAMLDCGQYGKGWPSIHMIPEETVRAATDIAAKVVLPAHWGKFVLSVHPWNEPVTRFMKAAESAAFKTITPLIGQPAAYLQPAKYSSWWNFEK